MVTAKKVASGKNASSKKVVPARKAAAKLAAPARRQPLQQRPKISEQPISGFVSSATGLLVPAVVGRSVIVPPNKLREGIEAAHDQIMKTLQGFSSLFTQEFEVSEVSLTLSFNADGKFLGFGVGGEMSVSIKIVPSQADDI